MQSGQPVATDLEKFQQVISFLTFPPIKTFYRDDRQRAYDAGINGDKLDHDFHITVVSDQTLNDLYVLGREIKEIKDHIGYLQSGAIPTEHIRETIFRSAIIRLHYLIEPIITTLSNKGFLSSDTVTVSTKEILISVMEKHIHPHITNEDIILGFISNIGDVTFQPFFILFEFKNFLIKSVEMIKEFEIKHHQDMFYQAIKDFCNKDKKIKEMIDTKNNLIKKFLEINANLSFDLTDLDKNDFLKFHETKKQFKDWLINQLDEKTEYEHLYYELLKNADKNWKKENKDLLSGASTRYSSLTPTRKQIAIYELGSFFRDHIDRQNISVDTYRQTNAKIKIAVHACTERSNVGHSDTASTLLDLKNKISTEIEYREKLFTDTLFENFISRYKEHSAIQNIDALFKEIITFSSDTDVKKNLLHQALSVYQKLFEKNFGYDFLSIITIIQSSLIRVCLNLVLNSNKNPDKKDLTNEAFFQKKKALLIKFENNYNFFYGITLFLHLKEKYETCLREGFHKKISDFNDLKSKKIYELGSLLRFLGDQLASQEITLNQGILRLRKTLEEIAKSISSMSKETLKEIKSLDNLIQTGSDLIRYAQQDNLEKVKEILSIGISVFYEDEKKNTLLHAAALSQKTMVLNYLLNLNILNVNAKNNEGKTPLDLADEKCALPVLISLKEYGARSGTTFEIPSDSTNVDLLTFYNMVKHLNSVFPDKHYQLYFTLGREIKNRKIKIQDMKERAIYHLGKKVTDLQNKLKENETSLYGALWDLKQAITETKKACLDYRVSLKSNTANALENFSNTYIENIIQNTELGMSIARKEMNQKFSKVSMPELNAFNALLTNIETLIEKLQPNHRDLFYQVMIKAYTDLSHHRNKNITKDFIESINNQFITDCRRFLYDIEIKDQNQSSVIKEISLLLNSNFNGLYVFNSIINQNFMMQLPAKHHAFLTMGINNKKLTENVNENQEKMVELGEFIASSRKALMTQEKTINQVLIEMREKTKECADISKRNSNLYGVSLFGTSTKEGLDEFLEDTLNPMLLASDRLFNALNVEKVKKYLSRGALLSTQNKEGNTALHCAIIHGKNEITLFLIQIMSDKDLNIKNKDGKTAKDLAIEYNRKEIVEKLPVSNEGNESGLDYERFGLNL